MIKPRSDLALIGAAAAWGSSLALTKHVLSVFPPLLLLAIMLSASVATLWMALLIRGEELPSPGASLKIASAGLLEPGLAYAVGVIGLSLSSAGEAALLSAIEPLIIAVLAWLAFGHRISKATALSGAVACAGVFLVAWPSFAADAPSHGLGSVLLFASVVLAGIYVTVSSALVEGRSALVVTTLQQSLGLLLAVGLAVLSNAIGFESWPSGVEASSVAAAVLAGVVQYAMAFWLYLTGLKSTAVTKAGLYLLLTPVFGLFCSIVFLGEDFLRMQIFGAALVLGAMATLARQDNGHAP